MMEIENGSERGDLLTSNAKGWCAKRIVIGRVVFEDVAVASHEGTMHLNNALALLLEKTKRRSADRLTRYPEPLTAAAPARLISEEGADYVSDMRRRNLSIFAIDTQERTLRLLKLAAGDIPVSDINGGHILKFWDVVRWWPKNVGNFKKYQGLTDEQILEMGKRENRPPPARGTLKNYHAHLGAFLSKLVQMRVIAFSPLDAFGKVRDDLVDVAIRRPFEQTELLKIFDPQTFIPWAMKYPHRWWSPILSLYSGARAAEIAQLKVADVICENGVWCLSLRKTVDSDLVADPNMRSRQRIKSKSSIRVIPIAQPILDAGFLDFLEDAKAAKHDRLFPHLPGGTSRKTGLPNGTGYGVALVGQFSRHLKEAHGVDKGIAFHAFRHLFVTALEEARVEKELIATITGHTVSLTVPALQKHYLHIRPETLRRRQLEALAKFDPGVQLPKYERGQFANSYRADARLYP